MGDDVRTYNKCEMYFNQNSPPVTIHLHDEFYCYYHDIQRITQYKQMPLKHSIIVNLILWPSLLFVAGFVGMFFSCIRMQHELSLMKKQKKQISLRVLKSNSLKNCKEADDNKNIIDLRQVTV